MRNARWSVLLATCLVSSAGAQDVDTVRVGSASLDPVRLRLGYESVQSFVLADGMRTPTSTTERVISRAVDAGADVVRIETRHASAPGDTTVGTIVVRASDFALLHHKVKGARDSASVTVHGTDLTGWVVLPDEPIRLLDLRLDGPVFPIEGQMPWLMPLLPFRSGYAAAVPHFSPWQGQVVWTEIRVLGSEAIDHAGRSRDCWKVDSGPLGPPGYRAFHWIEKGTARILRSALRGAPGRPEYGSTAREP